MRRPPKIEAMLEDAQEVGQFGLKRPFFREVVLLDELASDYGMSDHHDRTHRSHIVNYFRSFLKYCQLIAQF